MIKTTRWLAYKTTESLGDIGAKLADNRHRKEDVFLISHTVKLKSPVYDIADFTTFKEQVFPVNPLAVCKICLSIEVCWQRHLLAGKKKEKKTNLKDMHENYHLKIVLLKQSEKDF